MEISTSAYWFWQYDSSGVDGLEDLPDVASSRYFFDEYRGETLLPKLLVDA